MWYMKSLNSGKKNRILIIHRRFYKTGVKRGFTL